MITLSILLVIIAFYLHYTTSEKMDSQKLLGFEFLLIQQKKQCKAASFLLLILSCMLCIKVFGLGAGIFSFFIYLMTFGSLIVLLAPLKIFNYKSLSLFIFICFTIEYTVLVP